MSGGKHNPHRGSLQFWPRKRARRKYARVNSWKNTSDTKVLGFMGYKAGMTHILVKKPHPTAPNKTIDVQIPVTILECPPMKVYGLRYYKQTEDGLKVVGELYSKKFEKELSRKIKMSKKDGKEPEEFDDVRIILYTQPKMTGLENKKPELIEMGIGGKDPKEKAVFGKELLNNMIKLTDFAKEGHLVDIQGVTKGKGFQGTIKRYGVKRLQHKSEKKVRGIGCLGAWTPKKVHFSTAQPGKMGFHQRIDYNKLCLKLSEKPEEINPKGGFLHYGLIKNDYILIKGSIPGPVKRVVVMTEPRRVPTKFKPVQPEILYLSLNSKQGR